MTDSGRPIFSRASSVSASMKSTMPLTSACSSRCSTVPLRHSSSTTSGLVLLFDGLGEFDQALGGVGPAVEQDVLDQFEQVLGNLLVNAEHPGVDDAHVQPGLDGVIEKGGVHRLAHGVVAAKGKGNVADAAADLGPRQVLFDPARGLDEIDRVIVVLLHAGGDGQDVRVKNDVLRRKADLLGQNFVGAARKFPCAAPGCRPGPLRQRP